MPPNTVELASNLPPFGLRLVLTAQPAKAEERPIKWAQWKPKEVRTFMNVKAVKFVLSLATAMVVAASVGFARSWFGKSSTRSYSVTLDSAATLKNGTTLQAGNYTLKFQENTQTPEVEFYSGGKLIAKEQAKVQAEPQKNPSTSVELNTAGNSNVVTAIDPGGLPEKIVFTDSNT
jgi:hypothetical protein